MAFPTSNLPTSAVPWGREVEKQVNTVVSTVKSNEVNNAARDNQLAASLKRVQAAQAAADAAFAATGIVSTGLTALETDVNTLETNVYFPGTTTINGGNIRTGTVGATQISASYVYAGSVNANQITSGQITGITIQTAASGQRIVMGGTQLNFYDGSGSLGATMSASSNALLIANGGNGVNVNTTGSHMTGGSTGVWCGDYGSGTNVLKLVSTSTENTGTLFSTGGISTAGGLVRTAYAAGGTTGASFNNDGNLIRTPSSARYKQDISDIEFDYEAVMALQPKVFRLKEEAEVSEDAIFYPGFIAEEIAGTALDIFVSYQRMPDGTKRPDGVRYAELTAALLSAIKHQDGLIESLTARIEALESK